MASKERGNEAITDGQKQIGKERTENAASAIFEIIETRREDQQN